MRGFHVEGMSEHKGTTLASAKVCEPMPGDNALDSDDPIIPLGGNGLEKRLWARWHIAMQQELAMVVHRTADTGAGKGTRHPGARR